MPVTDEDAAISAITELAAPSQDQERAKCKIDSLLSSAEPFIDIIELFDLYSVLYFRSLLAPRVEVSWSPRLTLCAGICELVRDRDNGNKYTKIRLKLSEPLLKYRPRSDVLNTLLHECIHAYFFITTSWRHSRGDDGTGHGAGFLLLADAINSHGDYDVSVCHTFHDEVDSYRTHVWQCNGVCKQQPPFFGLVKRSMNRAPGKSDTWWQKHKVECGGTYTKIVEPKLSKEHIEKMSSLKRAGLQKHKLDSWIGSNSKTGEASAGNKRAIADMKRSSDLVTHEEQVKRQKTTVPCPICKVDIVSTDINQHLDEQHLD